MFRACNEALEAVTGGYGRRRFPDQGRAAIDKAGIKLYQTGARLDFFYRVGT